MSTFLDILRFIGWGTDAFLVIGFVGFMFEAVIHRFNRPRNERKMPDYDAPGGPWGGFAVFLAICLWGSGANAATQTFGNADTPAGNGQWMQSPNGVGLAGPFTAPADGNLQSVTAAFFSSYSPGKAVTFVIYADSSGTPGALLAEGSPFANPVSTTVITASMPAVTIVAGSKYWLGINGSMSSGYVGSRWGAKSGVSLYGQSGTDYGPAPATCTSPVLIGAGFSYYIYATTASAPSSGGAVVIGSDFSLSQGTLTVTGGTGNGVVTGGSLSYAVTGFATSGSLSLVGSNVSCGAGNGTFTVGNGSPQTPSAPVPGPFMMSAHRQVDAHTEPAKRFSVRIVERGGKLIIEVED